MKAQVYSNKPSKSGNSDILSLEVTTTTKTAFGEVVGTKFINMKCVKDTCTLSAGDEVDIDLNVFVIEDSSYTANDGQVKTSSWLVPKVN